MSAWSVIIKTEKAGRWAWSCLGQRRSPRQFTALELNSVKKCRFCGGSLELTRKMLDVETGRVIHMYECECGDRTWNDKSPAPGCCWVDPDQGRFWLAGHVSGGCARAAFSISRSYATINHFLTIHIQRADIVHPWAAGGFPWGLHGGNGMSRRQRVEARVGFAFGICEHCWRCVRDRRPIGDDNHLGLLLTHSSASALRSRL